MLCAAEAFSVVTSEESHRDIRTSQFWKPVRGTAIEMRACEAALVKPVRGTAIEMRDCEAALIKSLHGATKLAAEQTRGSE